MDMQVLPIPNQPKMAEILAQNASKMHSKRTQRQPKIKNYFCQVRRSLNKIAPTKSAYKTKSSGQRCKFFFTI